MPEINIKDEIRKMADRLPDDATWEDVHYQIHVLRSIEAGLKDSGAGRVVPLDEARRRFGLGPR